MKTTQILYLIIFVGVIVSIVTCTHLLDGAHIDGFQDSPNSEPRIAKTLEPTRLSIQAMPNSSTLATLPYGPYRQQAAIGSYQYQDPAQLPAELKQMKQLYEDLRSFLVFEGASVSNSSDPTVQLPLTQLRADSSKLQQEITVLEKNSGIQSTLTQQNLADIQGALTFLQRKVRLFQTSGVISGGVEGFTDSIQPKTIATEQDLKNLQTKIYAAILVLTSSGTTDPVVMARVKRLQDMYSVISDMVNKLDNGTWTAANVPVYKEDINIILPNLSNPQMAIMNVFSQGDGKAPLSPVHQQLAGLVGAEHAESVFNGLKDNGMFRVNVELGYNVPGSKKSSTPMMYSNTMNLGSNGRMEHTNGVNTDTHTDTHTDTNTIGTQGVTNLQTDSPFDTVVPGIEDTSIKMVGGLDWKQRAQSISEQIRLRGLDPQDFGCIPKGSVMSPAYSWRGHTKMICGRLSATMDPSLPVSCGCPPPNWAGWTTSHCPSLPPYLNKTPSNSKC